MALILVLGVFLGGVGPSWAVPSAGGKDMAMAGMPMPCAGMMGKSSPAKQIPSKDSNSSCAVCIACAVNVGAPQGFSPVTLLFNGEIRAVSRDANRSGIATPPPLPPPILNA